MPTPNQRIEISPGVYSYGGQTYKTETRTDGQGNPYTVDVKINNAGSQPVAPITVQGTTTPVPTSTVPSGVAQTSTTLTPTTTRYNLPTSDSIETEIASQKADLEKQRESQRVAMMDTINQKYNKQSTELMAQQRAINYNKGQVGAETGFAAKNKVSTAVEEARTAEIQTALTNLDNVFYERERNITSDAYAKAQYDVNIYDKLKAQEDADKKAINESLATLGKAGNTIEDIKSDPVLYDNMKKSGLSDLEIMATLNENSARPTEFQIIGNKIVGTYYDPKTNSIKTVTQDLGFELPEDPDNVVIQKLGDDLVIYDKAKKQVIETVKGQPTALEMSQIAENYASAAKSRASGGEVSDQLYSGLSGPTATAVRSKVTKFSTEPIVQNFATIQDGYTFSSSLATDTTNPADDQALIYSLAKALDPGSVVREGEYATAQKYAQSWIKAYGKGVSQAILGTGFLSQEARANIKKTIEQKYESSLKNYENIQKNYITGINNLTGRSDGEQFLVDYAMQSSTSQQPTQSNFSDIESSLRAEGNTVYIPRSVWSTLGARQDELLKEIEADGGKLLVE